MAYTEIFTSINVAYTDIFTSINVAYTEIFTSINVASTERLARSLGPGFGWISPESIRSNMTQMVNESMNLSYVKESFIYMSM